MAGELIARFRLGEIVSRSEPARLYAGRDELSGEPVSVALLGAQAVRTPGELRTFQKRVGLVAGLGSPHVAEPLTAGLLDGQWFVAYAGAPGATLAAVGERLGALEPREAFALGALLFRGLGHLHARGLTVRQVHPRTVLLGPDGMPRFWNLFGGSTRTAGKTVSLSSMDLTEMAYASVAGGTTLAASKARNVYGGGMTLAYLLAGGHPVRPHTMQDLLAFVQKPAFTFQAPLSPEQERVLRSTVLAQIPQRPPARRAYGELLAAAGLTARQAERIGRQVAARLADG